MKEKIHRHLVFPVHGQDQVRLFAAWLDELEVHRANGLFELPEDGIRCTSPLAGIPFQSSCQADLQGNVQEDFQVEPIRDLSIVKDQDAFQEDDRGRLKGLGFLFSPVR